MTDIPPQDTSPYPSPMDHPLAMPPQRVVSLVPSLTEALFDLDLGDRIVAITDYCTRPANRLHSILRVGGTKNPDVARIIALQPDMVLLNDEENRREDAAALHDANVPIWVTGPRTIFDALNLLWNIMAVFDHGTMSLRVREIERAYDYNLAVSQTITPVRVFAPIWRDPWMTFNHATYAHDVVRICGGLNVFADRERQFPLEADLGQAAPYPDDDQRVAGQDRRYPRITLDEVMAEQPEVVLLPDEPYAFGAAEADEFRALDIPAAHNERIHLIDGDLLTWYGTRVAYALRDLPALLMGDTDPHDATDT